MASKALQDKNVVFLLQCFKYAKTEVSIDWSTMAAELGVNHHTAYCRFRDLKMALEKQGEGVNGADASPSSKKKASGVKPNTRTNAKGGVKKTGGTPKKTKANHPLSDGLATSDMLLEELEDGTEQPVAPTFPNAYEATTEV